MKLILIEDVQGLGYKDDVVEVKSGYGRNYLIPQLKAVIASPSALKVLAENQRQRAHKLAKIKADAEALAAQIGLGRRQTERLLQMHYHKTFLQKKTAARMSAACSLLRDTSLSISSIAENLGYSSVEHFSTAFKKCYHMTPSAFRKRRMTVVSG